MMKHNAAEITLPVASTSMALIFTLLFFSAFDW